MKKIVKNKKLLLLIIIPIVIIITASIIILINNNNKKEPNNEIINIINKNSNLPIKYMSKYKENNKYFKKCDVIKNFMSHDYKNKDIVFSFYGYPTDESDYYLGRYTLLTSKYNLLGVKVGDGIKDSVINNGGQYGSGVNKTLDYLIVGSEAGPSKLDKAKELGVKMINEEEYISMIGGVVSAPTIRETSMPETKVSKPQPAQDSISLF